MFERIVKILSKYTEERQIQPRSTLAVDLGLSSFDVVEIVADFEEEFEIEISDRDIGKFICIEDIFEHLEGRIELQ